MILTPVLHTHTAQQQLQSDKQTYKIKHKIEDRRPTGVSLNWGLGISSRS